jgi:hypothetical protein
MAPALNAASSQLLARAPQPRWRRLYLQRTERFSPAAPKAERRVVQRGT